MSQWVLEAACSHQGPEPLRILDFGCGRGDDLGMIAENLKHHGIQKFELYGIECFAPSASESQKKGIQVSAANIESECFPYSDGFFDVVLSNQTIEHTKEIFWIFSEVSRVLKAGGLVLTGVPNLASFHNRLLLLFGRQPTSIELLGPHVRGITAPSFRQFLQTDGYFQVNEIRGGHFYPFPRILAQILSRLFPGASASLFIKAQRTRKAGLFLEVLNSRFFETPYFTGRGTSQAKI
ncbi:MAG: class I SAM-dependent methyltransferase [Pseudobdellovibrionaceae bacterium]